MTKSALRKAVFAPNPQELAKRGADALGQGRFKDATEIFKQLLREDPRPEWKQRLGDAYAGRARALSEKGMFKEAAIVLENTLASGGTIREPLLYLSCLIHQNQPQKARRVALDAMARPPAAEATRLAECAAVLSLAAPGPTAFDARNGGSEPWLEQNRAAETALRAWLQGQPTDEVDRLISRIPLRSPFGATRLILKSLITRDAAKARALLAMIPADSLFAGVRDTAGAALSDAPDLLGHWARLRPAQQQFVAEMRGIPRDRSVLLSQIQDAERRGPAALLSLLIRRGLPLPEDELRTACLNLLPAAPERMAQFTQRFGPLPPIERNRIAALSAEAQQDWDHAILNWRALVSMLERDEAPDSRLALAVVLRHMADLARTHPNIEDAREAPDADLVALYLERSLQADPTDLAAMLALLDRYRASDNPKEWYHAAELAVARFPANPIVLLHAVDAAVARNAFKKAAGFAQQVLAVDPINLPVRQRMIELQLAHARKQARSGRVDLAARSLDEASAWERPDKPDPSLRIARALVAMTKPTDPATADTVQAAVHEAGGSPLGWFRVVLEASLLNWPAQRLQTFQRELQSAYETPPDRATILALIGLLGQRDLGGTRRAITPALRVFDQYLVRGSHIDWSPAEFLTIAEAMANLRCYPTLHRYATSAVQREAGNLAARFYRLVAGSGGNRAGLNYAQESELFSIMEDAGTRQDFALFNRMQKFALGPAGGKAMRHMQDTLKSPLDELDEEDTAELLTALAGEMPSLPAREIRDMVNQLGRGAAIEMMASMLSESPMGEMFSEQQMQQFCTALVERAMDGRPRPRRRR
jgi:tetratricopeptide (TPR) repeat protein